MRDSKKSRTIVAAVYGSPRRNGSSSMLHDLFLGQFDSSFEIIPMHVYDMDIRPCTACGHCRQEFGCIFDDDMMDAYEVLRAAGLVSISSPLYFSSFPGPLKNFIDRCQVFWELNSRETFHDNKREGFFLSVGGGDYEGMFIPSVTVVRHYFNTMKCSFLKNDFLLYENCDTIASVSQEMKVAARAAGRKYCAMLTGAGK